MLDSLYVIIVIYNVRLDDCLTYRSLKSSLKQFKASIDLMVYDNSPIMQSYKCGDSQINLNYISDTANPGLSKGYNIAANYAKKLGKKWLLILDQDSVLPERYFEKLAVILNECGEQPIIAPILKQGKMILSPCKFLNMKGSNFKYLHPGKCTFENISIFNSGMLINLDVYHGVGGYSEEVSLDFSDHYFIHKIKSKYNSFYLAPIEIEHQLSTHSKISKERQLKRHLQFCKGGKMFSKKYNQFNLLFFWIFLRSVKLAILHKDIEFLKAYWSNFISQD